MTASVPEARELLAGARSVLVLTGAGVSAESGVPTFRGPDGLWRTHRPEELAMPEACARDPRLVWEWYGWRRERVGRCRPNAGHHALAAWALERGVTGGPGVTLVTQNVDGLHEEAAREVAGVGDPAPALPVELHGSLFRIRCTRCAHRASDRSPVNAASEASLPRCPACGALLRPNVVWFGEALDPAVLERASDPDHRARPLHAPRRLDQLLPFDLTAPVAAPGVHEHRECRRAQEGERAGGDVLGRRME